MDTLGAICAIVVGALLVVFHAPLARNARRQNEAFWGERFDERLYLIGFKYGGLLFIAAGVLVLLGVIHGQQAGGQ
jgi:hypothetical protein